MIGALFTDRVGDRLRVFCFYLNGDAGHFDVPDEGNRDSLHALFSKLDMVDQCTSVILEKVVRGRIYVEREGVLQSYTLLATPGDVLPAFNSEIYNLPWKTVWASQEAEVLKLSGAGNAVHCYAIRSRINDVDAPELYRSSCAFTNPMFAAERLTQPYYWVRPLAAAAGVVAVLALGWWLGYSTASGKGAEHVAARELKLESRSERARPVPAEEIKVQMLANRVITGPFTARELSQMNEGGKIPADAMFRVAGDVEWVTLREITSGK